MPRARPSGTRRDRRGYYPTPATPLSRAPNGARHPCHPDHRLDVVHPDDVGSSGDAQRDGRRGAFQSISGRQVERLANERLPREADQNRKPEPAQLGKTPDNLEVLLASFPESDARAHDEAILTVAGGHRQLST